MNILFGSAHPYIPQISGGAQSSTHDLAVELMRRGHNVSVLAGLTGQGWLGLKSRLKLKAGKSRYVVDRAMGYPVYRSWFAWETATDVADHVGADVVVLQSGLPVRMGQPFVGKDRRMVVYLRNVEIEDLGGDLRDLTNASFIANSKFTAARFKELYGLHCEMVYPLVRRENYETKSTHQNVTFINPHPLKGVDIALAIAERCREIPFTFIEAWNLPDEHRNELRGKIAALGNVTLRPGTRDMKAIYGAARAILAPSRWEEAFGRIAAEAHYSGIPVVGSNRGGLPEAIGPGGIIIDIDAPIDEWVSAVRQLWYDDDFYAQKSEAALKYSRRPEIDKDAQLDSLLTILSGNR